MDLYWNIYNYVFLNLYRYQKQDDGLMMLTQILKIQTLSHMLNKNISF